MKHPIIIFNNKNFMYKTPKTIMMEKAAYRAKIVAMAKKKLFEDYEASNKNS
jgi:hypothetical protein